MFGRRRDDDTLGRELETVDALISAHPLAAQRIRAAHEVVGDREPGETAEVDRELADLGLPGVEERGRTHVAGLWSWWKLHRRRRQLTRQIERRAASRR